MELKPGYKRTEVGAIPSEWECMTVAAVAAPVRNAIVGGPFGSDLVSADYVDDGVPVIRGQNMGARWVKGPFAFVTEKKASNLSANLARPGDVVFTQRGTLGQVAVVPSTPYPRYLVSQSQMKVSLNSNLIDSAYFHCLFSGERHQQLIQSSTIQTGVPHINLGLLRAIPVQVPPLPEQRAIADVLGDVDALLASLDRLIAKKRDLKEAAMQRLLSGQTRLPGFSGKWEAKAIAAVCRNIIDYRGRTPRKLGMEWGGGDIPALSARNVKMGRIDFDEECYFASDALYRRWMTNGDVARGDIVFTMEAPLGNVALIPDDRRYILSQRTVLLQPDTTQVFSPFLYQQLSATRFQRLLLDNATGSTAQGIQRGRFERLVVGCPPIPEQVVVAEVLSDMDAEIASLEARREKTRALKQGMMQELLTGRTRLI